MACTAARAPAAVVKCGMPWVSAERRIAKLSVTLWPPPEVFDWMREQEMTWHLMHDVWDRGMRPVIADAIARAGDDDHISVCFELRFHGICSSNQPFGSTAIAFISIR